MIRAIFYTVGIAVALGGLGGFWVIAGAESPPSGKKFQVNDQVQKAIKRLAENVTSEQELRDRARQLEKLSGGRAELVRQLVWFGSRAVSTREGMMPAVVVQLNDISEQEIVSALVPYLGAEDDKFKREIEQLLHDLEPGLQPPHRSFEYLNGVVGASARKGKFPPEPFVQFIYRISPGNSLHAMNQAYLSNDLALWRSLDWAEHVVRDAIWKKKHRFQEAFEKALPEARDQLSKLADSDKWWVRLYAAEILREHPEFEMPETVERLKRDENELVRQAANRAEKNRRKSPPSKQPRPVIDPNTLPNDPSIVPIPE